MLMRSSINPFDSPEIMPYKNDPRVLYMVRLVQAYQAGDMKTYEKILRDNRRVLLGDPFIAENIDEVSRTMRSKAVLRLVRPYRRFSLEFVAESIGISLTDASSIIERLISDGYLKARIDQVSGSVNTELETPDTKRMEALRDWTVALSKSWDELLSQGPGFQSVKPPPMASDKPSKRLGRLEFMQSQQLQQQAVYSLLSRPTMEAAHDMSSLSLESIRTRRPPSKRARRAGMGP